MDGLNSENADRMIKYDNLQLNSRVTQVDPDAYNVSYGNKTPGTGTRNLRIPKCRIKTRLSVLVNT